MKEAIVVLLAAHQDMLGQLNGWRGVVVLTTMVFAAGMGTNQFLGEVFGHEGRIEQAEAFHTDSVRPMLETLRSLERLHREADGQYENINLLLWCTYYEIEPCPGAEPPRILRNRGQP